MTPENVPQVFREALTNNDVDAVIDTLLRDDMNVDCRDVMHDMATPLMQLCHSSLEDEALTPSLLDVISSREPDVNLQDALGRTLGMHACIALRFPILQCVWSRAMDVSICDRTGKNVFHYGACSGCEAIMDLLLQHPQAKSALRVLDLKGYSPLDLARQVKSQSIVKKISQTLSGNSNAVFSTNRQPLKPFFMSSAAPTVSTTPPPQQHRQTAATTTAMRGDNPNPKSSRDNSRLWEETERSVHEDSAYLSESDNYYLEQTENSVTERGSDNESGGDDSSMSLSASFSQDDALSTGGIMATKTSCNLGRRNKKNNTSANNISSLESPTPHPRSEFPYKNTRHPNRSSLREAECSHDCYSSSTDDDRPRQKKDSLITTGEQTALHSSQSHSKKLSALTPLGPGAKSKPRNRDNISSSSNSSQSTSNQNQLKSYNIKNQSSNETISIPQPLAPVVSPRRKINLDVEIDRESSYSESPERTSSSNVGGHRSKTRQVITELKPDPRKHFGHSPKRDSNISDDNHFPTRPNMILPFKSSNQMLRRVKGLNASEADNLNALLSPQQPHKRLLFKRQRDMREEAKTSTSGKDYDDGDAYQDEDSLFEEEISLDSSLSSSGQGREQGRKSSLSLPDLRDMRGCLVSSQNGSPFPEEDDTNILRVNNMTNNCDVFDKSPIHYYSADENDDEEEDNDDAVLEDELSDDCIEDCFDDDINRYSDLYKRKGESKENRSDRPLPAIVTVSTSTKGKSKSLLKS